MSYRLERIAATVRIGCDLIHSLLRPLTQEAGPAPVVLTRPGPGEQPLGSRLTAVTWNIHRCYQPALIRAGLAEIIANEDPDLLLLQEVPLYPRARFWELEGINELLQPFRLDFVAMHQVHRCSSYYPFSCTGLLTASRVKTTEVRGIALPTVSRPKLGRRHTVRRVALQTLLGGAGQSLLVGNLHLENTTGPRGRLVQLRRVLEGVTTWPGPIVLGGDLNTLLGPLERARQELERSGFLSHLEGGALLLPQLDHFHVRGLRLVRCRRLATRGSDHRPLVLEVAPRS